VDRDGDGAIDRDEYLDLHVHLYAAMHFGGAEPPDLAEARRVAEREWDFDSQGRDGLDHDLFNLSFFQLVDAWRAAAGDAAASFADYCSFLLDRVAVVVDEDPRHVDLRWRHDPDGWLGDLPRFRSLRKAIASAVREADAMLGVLGLADPVDRGDASDGDTAALVEDAEEPAVAPAVVPTPTVFDDSVLSGARSAKVLDDARPAIFDDSLASPSLASPSLVPSLMQSLVDPFAGDDRLPPCLDSLVFAGDDAEAGDDATAAPAEADPEGDAPGDAAAASTASPAAELAPPSPGSPESEAPGDAAAASTASPAAEPAPPSPGSPEPAAPPEPSAPEAFEPSAPEAFEPSAPSEPERPPELLSLEPEQLLEPAEPSAVARPPSSPVASLEAPSLEAPSVVAPSLVAPSPPAFATPSATPSPSAPPSRAASPRGSPAAAASPRDAASPAPPSPDAAPAPGAADSLPVLPAALPPARASSPGSASRKLPTDESESPAATLLLSPASTFLRTLGHPDDDTTAPGDGASDGGPGGGAPGTEEPSADSAELAEFVRLERSRALHHFDDPALHHDHARAALRDEAARREAAARALAAPPPERRTIARVAFVGGAPLVPQARADTPEDSLSTAPDFASETESSATPPPRGSPLRRRRGAIEPTRRNRFKERAPFVAAAGGLTLAPGVDVASPKDAPPKLSAVERYLERLRRDALDDSDDDADGGDDEAPARRPSRQLPTFRGHAIFAARDQGRPVVPAAARREPPPPVWHSPRQVPANGPAVPKLLETEDFVLPRNLTRLEKFRAGLPVDAAPAPRRAAAAVRVDDVAVPARADLRQPAAGPLPHRGARPRSAPALRPVAPPRPPPPVFGARDAAPPQVEPAILRLRELPWAARIGRPADPPKRPRDELGRLRLPSPVVDASAESEATPRDPRVDQILKEQDRYAYVLRTYIKYL